MVEEKQTTEYICEECGKVHSNKVDALNCEVFDRKEKSIENAKEFEIKEEHLKLLKRMYVRWDNCEFGSPCIDPKRPYGNSDVITDIRGITKLKKSRDSLEFLHKEMEIVLQIVLCTQLFKTGKYRKTEEYDSLSWEAVD